MNKPLMKYVPQKYYSSIRDFYKDSEGYWINEVMTAFRKSIVRKCRR